MIQVIDARNKWNQQNMSAGRQGNSVQYIVVHGMATTDPNAVPVIWNGREASAHYGVKNGTVEMYVSPENTAWHSGNWPMNLKSIGVEHLNSDSGPQGNYTNAGFSQETISTSIDFVASLLHTYGLSIDRLIRHKDVVGTNCPQWLGIQENWDWYRAQVLHVLGGGYPSSNPAPVNPPAPVPSDQITAYAGLYIRTAPNTGASLADNSNPKRQFGSDTNITPTAKIAGDSVAGVNGWYKTISGNYIWSGGTSAPFNINVQDSGPSNYYGFTNSTRKALVIGLGANVRTSASLTAGLAQVKGTTNPVPAGVEIDLQGGLTNGDTATANGRTSDVWVHSLSGYVSTTVLDPK